MNNNIKVSVIIPVYNEQQYIRVCLDSVLNQTLREIEIICVDDGSTDESLKILNDYAQKDKRIKVFHQKNKYAGMARNLGISKAIGKYLAFLDADDIFYPTMLEETYICAEREKADIVVFAGDYFDDNKNSFHEFSALLLTELIPNAYGFNANTCKNMLNFTTPAPWNKLFQREFIIRNNLEFQTYKRANDIYFVEVALALADKIGIVNKSLIAYRTGNKNSLQGGNSESPLLWSEALKDVKKKLLEIGRYHLYKKSFMNQCLSNCIYYLESQTEGEAFEIIYNELKKNLFDLFEITGSSYTDYYNIDSYRKFEMIKKYSVTDYLLEVNKNMLNIKTEKLFLFPYELIPQNCDIILYAAGYVGTCFYRQIRKNHYCNIIAWVDKNVTYVEECNIIRPEDCKWNDCEYVIIAVEKKELSDNIRNYLKDTFAVNDNKMIWTNPVINIR